MKMTFRTLILAVLLLVLTAAPFAAEELYPLSRNDPQIRSAVDYILSCQNPDGGFNNKPDLETTNLKATANAAMALALTGDLNRAVNSGNTPLAYLTENGPDDTVSGGALGKYVMGLVAAGGDPSDVAGTDYVSRLKTKASFRGEENLFSEAYILLGLVAAGEAESSEAQDFIAYLMDKRDPNGGWGWGGGAPDLDTTGIVVCALLGAGVPIDSQPIEDAISYLKSQQNNDGGFPSSGMSANSNSISDNWAIMALNAAGVDPTEWRKGTETPITHLLSCQQESGVFWWKPETQGSAGFLMEETAYGIITLLGEWIPIKAAAPGEEVEGVTVTIHVLGDGAELFSGEVTVVSESFAKDGFDISNPTVLGALQETGTDYSLDDPAGTRSPIVSDLAGSGAAIYFVDGARQSDPISEYNLTGDECIVVSAPDTVLPLRMDAPTEAVTGMGFTIKVSSEDLDGEGNPIEAPLKGAIVTIESDTSSFEYTTDEEGNTTEIVLNEPGEYRVKAEKPDYIATFYLNCGYQVINCQSGEPVDVTIHVLNNGNPEFSGEVEVPTAKFQKDGLWVDNPTAMGALELTGVSYSLTDYGGGWCAVTSLAGVNAWPSIYANGAMADKGPADYDLSGGEWLAFSVPDIKTVPVLFLEVQEPSGGIKVNEAFNITVEEEYYDESYTVRRRNSVGATVIVEGAATSTYTTDVNGNASVTLNSAGEYKVKAEKAGCVGTYYIIPGGYTEITCQNAAFTDVTIHVLKNGNFEFSGEVEVPTAKFQKDGLWVDNPTAMGALELTGVSYSLTDYGGGWCAVTSLAGVNAWPSIYANGAMADKGPADYDLSGGEWLAFSVPDIKTVPVLFLNAPNNVVVGNAFNIMVEEEWYNDDWAMVRKPAIGATVIVEGAATSTYTTDVNGNASVTLNSAGEYKVKAKKTGCVGTYYIISGGYHFVTVTGESGLLSVTKSADRSSAKPGNILTYDITICNDDTFPVTKVNITDVLQMDSTLQFADPWPNEISGNELKWNFSEIVSGGREEITLGVNVSGTKASGYTLQNCVNVNALNDTKVLIGVSDCDEVFIGVRDPLVVTKTADKESVERGKKVEYTITVFNLDNSPITDVEVKDVFSRDVEFVSADPSPTRSYGKDERFSEIVWQFDNISSEEVITLEVIVPEMQDFEFDMELGVKGEGFVNVANDYSTSPPEYLLENNVYVSALNNTKSLVEASASADVAVADPGTELSTREHGSGIYEGDEVLRMRTANKSISMEKDVSAEYGTTTLGLYNNRSVTYSSRWTEEASAKNRLKSTTMHESYRHATNIDRESQILLDDKGSSLAVESEFEGMGHIGLLQKSDPHALPDFVSSDDYTGSFKISQKAESSSIKYKKSATGSGFAVADKRVGDKQRSYEHGTGLYESDEVIEAATNYIAKDISLVYQPTTFDFGGDLLFDSTNKWKEGIWSKNVSDNSVTYIGEEFSSLDSLEKETIARGLEDVATEAKFSGRGQFRTIAQSGNWSSDGGPIYISSINLADEWVEISNRGDEKVDMTGWNLSDDDRHNYTFPVDFILSPEESVKVHTFKGTNTHKDLYMGRDASIWNNDGDCAILKDANGNLVDKKCTDEDEMMYEIDIDDEYFGDYSIQRRVVFAGFYEYDEPHISISKSGEIFYEDDAILARYNILAENDGNSALGPLVIKDFFPPGAEFINASERLSELSDDSAEWTFVNLGLGSRLDITLWLNVTDYQGDELVNRIVASGGNNGGEVQASNFSAIEVNWLECCLDGAISVTKEGKLDQNEPNVISYTLDLENLDDSTKAVRVTDFLPEGMNFLNASIEPASIEGNAITWNLIDIGSKETVSIVYRTEALRSGKFVNQAEIDARSIDGFSTPVVYANAVVDVPKFEGEVVAPGWQPPDWGFEYKDYPNNLTCEEICNLEVATPSVAKVENGLGEDVVESVATSDLTTETAETRGAITEVLLSETSGNVEFAVDYLLTCQNEDGGFSPKPGAESSLSTTAFATIAFASAGEEVASHTVTEMSSLDYLLENSDSLESSYNPEAQTGRYVVALAAAGRDPHDISGTDYVEVLKSYSDPRGEIGKENYIWDDSWVVLALAAAGEAESEEVAKAAEYLESCQTDSGGWAWHGGEGGVDPDTSGLVVCTLMAAGVDPSADSITKALAYFKSEQNDDGGFSSLGSNSASDSWVIMALNAAGQNPKEWQTGSRDPVSHLSHLQKKDGAIWWKENSEGTSFQWTAYGVVAMTGGTLPPNVP